MVNDIDTKIPELKAKTLIIIIINYSSD